MSINYTELMALQRTFVKDSLIDTCEIKRTGTPTISSRGIVTPAVRTNVQYEGSNSIPCRVEVARAFMNDRNYFQPVVTDNYVCYLPHDIDIQETDEIEWNGDQFDIRKVVYAGNMDAYAEVLMMHTDKNNP